MLLLLSLSFEDTESIRRLLESESKVDFNVVTCFDLKSDTFLVADIFSQ